LYFLAPAIDYSLVVAIDSLHRNSAFEGQIVPGENLFMGVESGYTVSSGEYVLDVSSDCVWSVTVSMTRS